MMRHLAAAAVVVCLGAGARAEEKAFSDADFVKKAASGGMKEVMMGKLATAMGQTDGVKKFGQQLVTDHTKANEELVAVATAAKLDVPKDLLPEDQKDMDAMKHHKGDDFDKHFAEHMVKDHEKDITLFTQASKEAKDPNVKAFAAKTLPTLQQHLEMAKKLHGGGK